MEIIWLFLYFLGLSCKNLCPYLQYQATNFRAMAIWPKTDASLNQLFAWSSVEVVSWQENLHFLVLLLHSWFWSFPTLLNIKKSFEKKKNRRTSEHVFWLRYVVAQYAENLWFANLWSDIKHLGQSGVVKNLLASQILREINHNVQGFLFKFQIINER